MESSDTSARARRPTSCSAGWRDSSTAATTRRASPSSTDDGLTVVRRVGKLVNLQRRARGDAASRAASASGTRAGRRTAGRARRTRTRTPTAPATIAVVHNGIIENYVELREELAAAGHILRSETDTETVAHLVESYYEGDLAEAVAQGGRASRGQLRARASCTATTPSTIVAARKDSPLIIGVGRGREHRRERHPRGARVHARGPRARRRRRRDRHRRRRRSCVDARRRASSSPR